MKGPLVFASLQGKKDEDVVPAVCLKWLLMLLLLLLQLLLVLLLVVLLELQLGLVLKYRCVC